MPGAAFFQIESLARRLFTSLRHRLLGPGRAACDPLAEVLDDGRREFLFGRHSQIGIAVGDRFEEEALVWLARDERGPGLSTDEEMLEMIELEGSL